jgi:hypothetical protein
MINSLITTAAIHNTNQPIVTTLDAEYGVISWVMREDGLFVSEAGGGWFKWEDHEMPPEGDAAMSLEQDTADLVKKLFAAIS